VGAGTARPDGGGHEVTRRLVIMMCAFITALIGACGGETLGPSAAMLGARTSGPNIGADVTPLGSVRHPNCTIYVSPNGRPRARGQASTAPTQLSSAVRRVRAGGVICLEPGIYDTRTSITLKHSGRHSAPITITGDRDRPLIQFTGGSQGGGVLQTTFCKPWCATHDLVIENLTIDGRDRIAAGIFAREGARDIKIYDCLIRNTGAGGVQLNAVDYVTVDHNLIYHAGYNQGYSSGISLWYGGSRPVYGGPRASFDNARGFHDYIVNNVITGSFDNSRHVTEGHGILVDGGRPSPAILIANNLTYENAGAGISVFSDHGGAVWIVNNTSYRNALDNLIGPGFGSEIFAIYSNNIHWINNLAFGHGIGRGFRYSWTFNNTQSRIQLVHNMGYRGAPLQIGLAAKRNPQDYVYRNPRFVHAPPIPPGRAPWGHTLRPWSIGDDFALSRNSPAIGRGVVPSQVPGVPAALRSALELLDRR
jgi:hypothetical protein